MTFQSDCGIITLISKFDNTPRQKFCMEAGMSGLVTLQNVYSSVSMGSYSTKTADGGLSFSEYLNSFVDEVDGSVPTYGITKEQEEWLDSRHDLLKLHNDTMAERIIDNLVAAGILKSEEDDEEEEENKAVDELLKAIKARQKTLKEEKIGKKKIEFTVEEVKEVLAGLHGINSMTVKKMQA